MSNIVLGTVDQGGDGLVILLAAVSAAKGKDFQMEDFAFTNPEINTNVAFQRNSFIKMQPLAASGYYGVNTIYYNRINGSELETITLTPADAVGKTLISELLPIINDQLGIYVKSSDILDGPIPAPDEEGVIRIDLVFSESSVIYYSGAEIIIPPEHVCPPCPPSGGWIPSIVFLDTYLPGINVSKTTHTYDRGRSILPARLFDTEMLKNTDKSIRLNNNYTTDDTGYLQMEHRTLASSSNIDVVITNRLEKNRVMAAWGEFNADEVANPDVLQDVYYMDEFGNVLRGGQRINEHFGTSTNSTPINRGFNFSADDLPVAEHYYTEVITNGSETEYNTYTPHWRMLCVKNGGNGYIHALVVPNYDDTFYKTPQMTRPLVKLCGQSIGSVDDSISDAGYDYRQYAYYVYSTDNGLTWRTGREKDESDNYYNEESIRDDLRIELDGLYKYQMGSNQMYASGNKVCIVSLVDHARGIVETNGVPFNKTAKLTLVEIDKVNNNQVSTDSRDLDGDLDDMGPSPARSILGIYLCDRVANTQLPTVPGYTSGFIAPTTDLEDAVADDINGFILLSELGTITMHHFNTRFSAFYDLPSSEARPESIEYPLDTITIRPCKNGYDPFVFIQYGSAQNIDTHCLKVMAELQPVTIDLKLEVQPLEVQSHGVVSYYMHHKAHVFVTPSKLSKNPGKYSWITDSAVVVQESWYLETAIDTDQGRHGFQPAFYKPDGLMDPNGDFYANEDFSSVTVTNGNVKSVLLKGIQHKSADKYGVYDIKLVKWENQQHMRVVLGSVIDRQNGDFGDENQDSVTLTISSDSVSNYAVGSFTTRAEHSVDWTGVTSLVLDSENNHPYSDMNYNKVPDKKYRFSFDGTSAFLFNPDPADNEVLYGAMVDFDYIAGILYSDYSELGDPEPPITEPKGLYPFPVKLSPLSDYDISVQPFLKGIAHTVSINESTRWYDSTYIKTPTFLMKQSNLFNSFKMSSKCDYLETTYLIGPNSTTYAYNTLIAPAYTVGEHTNEKAVSVSRVRQEASKTLIEEGDSGSILPKYRMMPTNGEVFPDGQFFRKNFYGYYKAYTQVTGMLSNFGESPSTPIDTIVSIGSDDTLLDTDLSAQLFSKGLSNTGAKLEIVSKGSFRTRESGQTIQDYGQHELTTAIMMFPKYGSDVVNQRLGMNYYGVTAPGATYGNLSLTQTALGYASMCGYTSSSAGYLHSTSETIDLCERLYAGYLNIECTIVSRRSYYPNINADTVDLESATPNRKQFIVFATLGGVNNINDTFGFTTPDAVEYALPETTELPNAPDDKPYNRVYRSLFEETPGKVELLTVVSNGYSFYLFSHNYMLADYFNSSTPGYLYGLEKVSSGEVTNIQYLGDLTGAHTPNRLLPVRVDNTHSIPYPYKDSEDPPVFIEAYIGAHSIFYDTHNNCFVMAKVVYDFQAGENAIHIEKIANGFSNPVTPESDIYFSFTKAAN